MGTLPLGVFVLQIAFPVERVGRGGVAVGHVGVVERLQLAHVQHGRAQVGRAVGEGAVGAVLGAQPARVRVVHAHACLVVPQVVAPLRVARGAVQVWTSITINDSSLHCVLQDTILL